MPLITAVDPAYPGVPAGDRSQSIVLAADRGHADPVAQAAGTPCKAMSPVADRPMVERVTDALAESGAVSGATLCGPARDAVEASPRLVQRLSDGWLTWRRPASTPSASVIAALDDTDAYWPLIVTTGDHALLTQAMVAAFHNAVAHHDWDAALAVVPYSLVRARYPEARPTATRLREGGVCGCNLFALRTGKSRHLVDLWHGIEERRKHPWRTIAGTIGLHSVIDYGLGRLTLATALERLSQRLGIGIGAVVLPYAAAGLDVDTVADWHLADRLARSADSLRR